MTDPASPTAESVARSLEDSAASAPSLAAGVLRHAGRTPAAPALTIGDRTWSYADLRDAALAVAASMRRGTTIEAPRVGILASRSIETYAGILGAAAAGGTYVPIHPKQPPARVASIVARAGLSAIVVDEAGRRRLDDEAVRSVLPPCVLLPEAIAGVAAAGADPVVSVAHDHPAYVMFTSGTTGTPKGVVVTAGNVEHFLAAVRNRYAIGGHDRVGQFAETSFDLSVVELFAAWDGGACLVVLPESQLMAPAGFIRRERLTVLASVPSVISMLARLKLLEPGMFPTLRVSFFIGEALASESARAWQAAAPSSVVDNHYGPTEATVACTVQRVGDPLVETPGRGTVAIGAPYPGMHAEIVDDDGRFLGDGETGELALSGPQVTVGYLDDDVRTAARFPTLDHPRLGRTRWYRTGDLALRGDAGILHWLGRVDHQVKILGHRVELEDVEAHLRAASGTTSVAAVAWPIVAGNATGLAAFVSGSTIAPREIRARLKQAVPAYMVPRVLRELDALPLTANGKVDRAALRALLDESR